MDGREGAKIVIVFEKLRFQNVFHPHLNTKLTFSNSSDLKSVFEKLSLENSKISP